MGDRFDRRRLKQALDKLPPGSLPGLAPFLFPSDEPARFGLGHNNGPPLESPNWVGFCWRKAHERAWASPPLEVIRMRMKRAQELGMTYREYTAIIMDRGIYL